MFQRGLFRTCLQIAGGLQITTARESNHDGGMLARNVPMYLVAKLVVGSHESRKRRLFRVTVFPVNGPRSSYQLDTQRLMISLTILKS